MKTKVFDENFKMYEDWFVLNDMVYKSELNAVEKAIPGNKNGFEIGIGSGLFAQPLAIKEGIEPSVKMRVYFIGMLPFLERKKCTAY